MTKIEVLDLLKENRDARGEANWQAVGDRTGGLTSFGIGLTKLRAIAKQVGRDHDLALTLWNERNHDAKIIGLLASSVYDARGQRGQLPQMWYGLRVPTAITPLVAVGRT